MMNIKTKGIRTQIGIIIALACAGAFFSLLGPAPGYENMFRFLMVMTMLLIMVCCLKALTIIRSTSHTHLTEGRQFYNITLSEVCK